MKVYRCVIRGATDEGERAKALTITAADCRAAASAAMRALQAGENDWIEVWDQDEMVLMRRRSNLHPLQAAIQMAKVDLQDR
jgi:hypothetical protein